MRIIRLLTITTVIIVLAIPAFAQKGNAQKGDAPPKQESSESTGIQWMAYDDGLVKAKAEDKHVLIDFTTTWCGWCKKMEASTFVDPQVVQMLNDNFVAVKVDGDSKKELDIEGYKISERDLTRAEYGVTGYPAFWFLKSDGSKIGKLSGYQQTARFLDALAFVHEKKYEAETPEQAPKGDNN
ncbi:MAG: DUF255 domain-containing protein [bacterium]|nr:DUF255 domain-containing protein [bacterium]